MKKNKKNDCLNLCIVYKFLGMRPAVNILRSVGADGGERDLWIAVDEED